MNYYLVFIVFIGLKILLTKQTDSTTVTLTTSEGTTNYTLPYPQTNSASVRVLSLNVTLQTDVTGKWRRPDSTEVDSNSITFPTFTLINEGLYTFYVNNSETIRILIAITGINFAKMTSQGNYIPLLDNEIFYTDTTLVYATSDTSQQIEWTYQPNQTATASSRTTSSSWNASTGISTLEIMTSEQGYYSCQVGNLGSYNAAIFNPDNTIVVAAFSRNYYVKGIDPTNILLLCDLNNPNIPLKDVRMNTPQSATYDNPIVLNDLNQFHNFLLCADETSSELFSSLSVIEPVFTSNYSGMSTQTYTILSPSNIDLNIPPYSTQVQLTTNLGSGTWHTPLSNVTNTTHTIQTFTLTSQGRYTFSTNQTWNGDDRQIFMIDIAAIGTPFAIENSAGEYDVIANNEIFYSDTKLVCLTDSNTAVSWFYQTSTLATPRTGVPSNNIRIISSEGISILSTNISSQGFYSCDISNNGVSETYIAGVVDPVKTITLQSGISYLYTAGVDSADSWVLCDPNSSSRDLRTVYISNADGFAFGNLLKINNFRNYFDSPQSMINCYYISQSDKFLTVNLYVQGPPLITLTADSTTTYSLLPPSTNTASVRVLSQNVTLRTNLIGKWKRPDNTEVISDNITFSVFTANHAGLHQFYVTSFINGNESLAIQIRITATGTNFAVVSSQGNYVPLVSNIFYTDTTLVCATSDTSQQIQWKCLPTQTSTPISKTGLSQWNANTGISTLNIMTSSEGYYVCLVLNQATYTTAIFNMDNTIRLLPGMSEMSHSYVKGIDPINILLLCDLGNSNIVLSAIKWVDSSTSYNNPLILNELNAVNELILECRVDASSIALSVTISIFGPPLITLTVDSTTTHSLLPPSTNTASVRVLSQNVTLRTNLIGKWRRPDNTEVISDNITFPVLTVNHAGLYQFYVTTWNGVETLAIQISLTTTGPLLALKNTTGYFALQNNTFGQLNTELACFASNQDANAGSIKWYYQETASSEPQMKSGDYNDQLGAANITVIKEGIYTCRLQGNMLLSVWVLVLADGTQILSNEDLDGDDNMTYIKGDSLTLFYHNPNISLFSIHWTTDIVQNGDTDTILEFYNNIDISDVFAQLGSGAYRFSCFYRQSPITVVGSLNLNMKDTAFTKLEYNGTLEVLFTDVNNANFPHSQTIDIPILTENIKLTCDTSMCEWSMERDSFVDYSISDTEYVIDVLRIENQGLYSLRRKTSTDVTYSTAGFMLTVTGFKRQSIISLNHSDVNIRPITLFWELETVLPNEANQTFTISYTENSESYKMTTTDTTFELTNLISGRTYTIYVTLSYAYTLETSNKSVVITQSMSQGGSPLETIIPALMFLMFVLVAIAITLFLITIIFKMRKTKNYVIKNLEEGDSVSNPAYMLNGKEYKHRTCGTQQNDFSYNHHDTESMMTKPQIPEPYSKMRGEKSQYNITYYNDQRQKSIPLDMFKKHVDQLWEKENTLEEEYDSLGGDAFRYTCDKAQIQSNKPKNKYKFIYPYDKSRVVLKEKGEDEQSDYINANHIPGLYVPQHFIASQGPKEKTLKDFWRMIFEQNIVNIVMVTNLIEGEKRKCEAYFPSNNGEQVEYGPYKLTNTQTDFDNGSITRMFEVECNEEHLQIKHFHFTAWPDHDVPTLYDELLFFVGTVQDTMMPSKAPILVHCSAGVGRTGTFITLFNLRSAISQMKPISIYQVVNEMREHRPHMVQTFCQYKFIYLAVLELLLGKTSIPAEDFTNTYNSYLESDQEGYVSVFYQQFSELDYQCKKSFYLSTDVADNNPDKNPSGEIVPFDHNRVAITSPFFPCDYINASYHEGIQFITTIHPDANTLVDFFQMVYQTEAVLVVMLATSEEKSEILGNMSDRKAYWPNNGVSLNVPPFEVSVTNSEKSIALIKQEILLKNNSEQSERTFMQVISTAWNEKGGSTDFQSIIILLQLIIEYRQANPNNTIVIHCQDGIGKTGIIYTVYQCIQEMKGKGQIDIFHTIKRLRRERMNFVPTLTHFCSCFAVMNEYCSST